MYISNVKEAGNSNILKWALSNGADIKNDDALVNIIGNDLFYIVTIEDVNGFELFRLTQMYRDKLRIVNEHIAVTPTRSKLNKLFPGECVTGDEKTQTCELAENAIESFMNLAKQMMVDDDIIKSNASKLFVPMISSRFDIQIPVAFSDLIQTINDDEYANIFNDQYPGSLDTIISTDNHGFVINMTIGMIKSTMPIKYNKNYDKYVNAIKYSHLKKDSKGKLYNVNPICFKKLDNVSRSEVSCSLFKPDVTIMPAVLKRLQRINAPINVEFVVKLPIHYMRLIQNMFDRYDLPITYESSMSHIIDGSIIFNDFKTMEIIESDDTENTISEEHENNISAYKVRIEESNHIVLDTISKLLSIANDVDIDTSSTFAILPLIYSTACVMTVNENTLKKLLEFNDPVIAEMAKEMSLVLTSITSDINRA